MRGFSPHFESCSICFSDLTEQKYYFSNENNGIVCSECTSKKDKNKEMNLGMIRLINKVLQSKIELLDRFRMTSQNALFLFGILESFIQSILQKIALFLLVAFLALLQGLQHP